MLILEECVFLFSKKSTLPRYVYFFKNFVLTLVRVCGETFFLFGDESAKLYLHKKGVTHDEHSCFYPWINLKNNWESNESIDGYPFFL